MKERPYDRATRLQHFGHFEEGFQAEGVSSEVNFLYHRLGWVNIGQPGLDIGSSIDGQKFGLPKSRWIEVYLWFRHEISEGTKVENEWL
jgi:hypothetical protein